MIALRVACSKAIAPPLHVRAADTNGVCELRVDTRHRHGIRLEPRWQRGDVRRLNRSDTARKIIARKASSAPRDHPIDGCGLTRFHDLSSIDSQLGTVESDTR